MEYSGVWKGATQRCDGSRLHWSMADHSRWHGQGHTPVDEGSLAVHRDRHLQREGRHASARHLNADSVLGGDDGAVDGCAERGHGDEVPLLEL